MRPLAALGHETQDGALGAVVRQRYHIALKSLHLIHLGLATACETVGRIAARHSRGLSAGLAASMAVFGVTAFGIAPMAPDAAALPKRMVTENVVSLPIEAQLEALVEHELQLYRTDISRASDTADSLLKRLGVTDAAAARFLRTDATARRLLEGRGGKMLRIQTDDNGSLTGLIARYAPADAAQAATHFTRLSIKRDSVGFMSSVETAPLAAQIRMGSGTVNSSLFAATDEARIPDNVATQLADVFATDIDFHRELRKGDTFAVIYEALTADGEPITWGPTTAGRVLAADFVSGGRTYSAMWFRDAHGKGAYYGFDGQSKKRSFLASPVEFSRVTSGFAMRTHPIHQTWQQHKGVDYGAPQGTAVRAVGSGVVDFAGWQNGYGNVVEVRHSQDRSTLYAHLSRLDVKPGAHIEQGQTVGAVGATGWATGPHLHFEVKVGGVQQNPLLLAKASEPVVLAAGAKTEFSRLAHSMKGQLEVADSAARRGAYAE